MEAYEGFVRELLSALEEEEMVYHTYIDKPMSRPLSDLPLDYQAYVKWASRVNIAPVGSPMVTKVTVTHIVGCSISAIGSWYSWYTNPEYWKPKQTPQLPFYYVHKRVRWWRRDQLIMIRLFKEWKRKTMGLALIKSGDEKKIREFTERTGIF